VFNEKEEHRCYKSMEKKCTSCKGYVLDMNYNIATKIYKYKSKSWVNNIIIKKHDKVILILKRKKD